jgi:uncharacterized protein involved in exopolysaccharide biosynthesis
MMNQLGKMGIEKHNSAIDFKRYQRLLWNKKYIILTIASAVTAIWLVLYFLFFSGTSYESSAVVKFDDPRLNRNVGAVTDFAIMGAHGKLAVLRTQSFLSRVVDSLHYNIVFNNEKIFIGSLCKEIKVEKNAVHGQYFVEFDQDTLRISFMGSPDILEEELVVEKYFALSENPY